MPQTVEQYQLGLDPSSELFRCAVGPVNQSVSLAGQNKADATMVTPARVR
jgi:hypothetical protein